MPPPEKTTEAASDRAYRRKVLKSAMICFHQRHSTYPCTVRNISDLGAQLLVDVPERVPDAFELHIELDGLWANCEVVWRGRGTMGVRFLEPATIAPPKRKQTVTAYVPPVKPTLRRPTIRKQPRNP